MNDKIQPCPKCNALNPYCEHIGDAVQSWQFAYEEGTERDLAVSLILGNSVRAVGVTNIADLTARLAPDPRVAVLSSVASEILTHAMSDCKHCRVSFETHGCCCLPHNLLQNKLIAAERGV